jgi:hypothetical protein
MSARHTAGLENRSSRPRSAADDASAFWRDTAARLRREYRLTGAEIAERLHLARSTVAGWLTRMGMGRLATLEPKEPVRRYQRERPGEAGEGTTTSGTPIALLAIARRAPKPSSQWIKRRSCTNNQTGPVR